MRYDGTELPTGYDRARARSPEVLARWVRTAAEHAPPGCEIDTVVDLGCGTGRFSGALHAHLRAPVVGVDPSLEMIRQALPKHPPAVRYVLGAGERLPLRSASVDLVFISMAVHHFADLDATLKECARVLGTAGFVFIRNAVREGIPRYPISRWFPRTVPMMEKALPSAAEISAAAERAGLRTTGRGVLEQEIAATHAELAEQVVAGGDSFLARLEPADRERGLADLRSFARTEDPVPVLEPVEYLALER